MTNSNDGKNLSLNPQTNEWEYLTPREWWNLKHGFKKDDQVDEWTLLALDGAEIAIPYIFDLDRTKDRGTINWLSKLFNQWPRPINTGTMLSDWRDFILEIYNFDTHRAFLNEFHDLAERMKREMWERKEAKRELDNYTVKEAKKLQKQLIQLKRKRRRK